MGISSRCLQVLRRARYGGSDGCSRDGVAWSARANAVVRADEVSVSLPIVQARVRAGEDHAEIRAAAARDERRPRAVRAAEDAVPRDRRAAVRRRCLPAKKDLPIVRRCLQVLRRAWNGWPDGGRRDLVAASPLADAVHRADEVRVGLPVGQARIRAREYRAEVRAASARHDHLVRTGRSAEDTVTRDRCAAIGRRRVPAKKDLAIACLPSQVLRRARNGWPDGGSRDGAAAGPLADAVHRTDEVSVGLSVVQARVRAGEYRAEIRAAAARDDRRPRAVRAAEDAVTRDRGTAVGRWCLPAEKVLPIACRCLQVLRRARNGCWCGGCGCDLIAWGTLASAVDRANDVIVGLPVGQARVCAGEYRAEVRTAAARDDLLVRVGRSAEDAVTGDRRSAIGRRRVPAEKVLPISRRCLQVLRCPRDCGGCG